MALSHGSILNLEWATVSLRWKFLILSSVVGLRGFEPITRLEKVWFAAKVCSTHHVTFAG